MFNNNQEFEYFAMPMLEDKFQNEALYKNKESFEKTFVDAYLPRIYDVLTTGASLGINGNDFENNVYWLDAEQIKNNGLIPCVEQKCNNFVYPLIVFKIPKQYLVEKGYAGHIDKPLPMLYPIALNATAEKRGENYHAVRTQLVDGVYSPALINKYLKNPNYSSVFDPAGGIFTAGQMKNIKRNCTDETIVKTLSDSVITNNLMYFADYRHERLYTNLQARDRENHSWDDAVSNYSQIYGGVNKIYGINKEKLAQCFRPNFRRDVLGEIEKFDKNNFQVDFSFESFAKSLNANHPLKPVLINNEWVVKNTLSGRYLVENERLLLQQRLADNIKFIIREMPDKFKNEYGSILDSIENNTAVEDNRLRLIYETVMSIFGEDYIGNSRINNKNLRVDLRTPTGKAIMKVNSDTNFDQECNYVIIELLRNDKCRKVAYDFAGEMVKVGFIMSNISEK